MLTLHIVEGTAVKIQELRVDDLTTSCTESWRMANSPMASTVHDDSAARREQPRLIVWAHY